MLRGPIVGYRRLYVSMRVMTRPSTSDRRTRCGRRERSSRDEGLVESKRCSHRRNVVGAIPKWSLVSSMLALFSTVKRNHPSRRRAPSLKPRTLARSRVSRISRPSRRRIESNEKVVYVVNLYLLYNIYECYATDVPLPPDVSDVFGFIFLWNIDE